MKKHARILRPKFETVLSILHQELDGVGIASDCIECELCMDECPQQINIPEVLKDVAKTFETDVYGFTE